MKPEGKEKMLRSEIWQDIYGFYYLKRYVFFLRVWKTKLFVKSTHRNLVYGYDLKVLDSFIFLPYKATMQFNSILENSGKTDMRFLSVKTKKEGKYRYVEIIDK